MLFGLSFFFSLSLPPVEEGNSLFAVTLFVVCFFLVSYCEMEWGKNGGREHVKRKRRTENSRCSCCVCVCLSLSLKRIKGDYGGEKEGREREGKELLIVEHRLRQGGKADF